MKRKLLAMVLSVALLMGCFAATGLSVAAADDLVVTYAKYLTDKTNFMAGKTPLSGYTGEGDIGTVEGSDAALITNNAYAATAQDAWQGSFTDGSRLVYNLQGLYNMNTFLVSSVPDAAKYVQDVSIYVADTMEDLFKAETLAVTTALKEVGGRVTQPGETVQSALISIMGKSFRGRFIGFDFNTQANAAVFGDTLMLGELGAYGNALSGAPTIELTETTPVEKNLLLEASYMSGYKGDDGEYLKLSTQDGTLGVLSDGELAMDEYGRWCSPFGNGDKIFCDLGETALIYQFLVGSEKGMEEWVTKFKIYVSNSNPKDLFNENNLKVVGNVVVQNNLITIKNGNIIGRYIGFDFSESTVPYGGRMRYFMRLGELGVYGLTAPEVDANNSEKGIDVYWESELGAERFEVYRSQDVISHWTDWELLSEQTDIGFTDTTAVNGEWYRYRVVAYRGDDVSPEGVTVNNVRCLSAHAVTVTKGTNSVKLDWNLNTMASTYTVLRREKDEFGDWTDWTQIGSTVKSTFTDADIKKGVEYSYAVSGVAGESSSAPIAGESVLFEKEAVKAPGTPKVTVTNTTSGIKASWKKVSNADTYRVYRRTYSNGKWGSWTRIKSTSKTAYTDTKAKAGKSYRYMVKAVNDGVAGKYKSTDTIRRLKATSSVKLAKAKSGFKVTWKKVTGAKKYEVYRKLGNGSYKKIKTTSSVTYTDKTAKKGKYYTYRVRAVYNDSKSVFKTGKKTKR